MCRSALALAIVLMGFAAVVESAQATTLYGSDQGGNLFTVDIATGAGTLVGPAGTLGGGCCTEIEYDFVTGSAFAQDRDGAFTITEFDINTGALMGAPVFDSGSYNGLEFIGTTLYGTFITGPGGPSTLATLDPSTGASVSIGLTGVGPVVGLAWDGTTMYGIQGGTVPADLYTIDLTTGSATPVGNTGLQFGSLEFGPDGQLYAGGTGANAGNIYTIDVSTAAASLVGNYGLGGGVTGLTLVPEPNTCLLLSVGLLGLAGWRRVSA